MKQTEIVNIKETGIESKQFQIKAGQAAFEVLSNTLYSDSILAVCRELITNAVDAIKNGGVVDVHAPTYDEPYFSVTDTGVGMTEDEIYDNYTSYFSSTKSDSNDEIGAFGLGSKSPFAYVDSFIVKSAKNGIENTFYAYKSSGAPALTKLDTQKVNYSGTQVSFDVNKQFETFNDRIIRVLAFLNGNIVHNLGSREDERLNKVKTLFSADFISSEDYSANSIYTPILGGSHAFVMGGVRYPIDSVEISESIKRTHPEWTYLIANILSMMHFNMHVEIGDISITPSRESVKFDQKTKALLDSRVSEFICASLLHAAENFSEYNYLSNFLTYVFSEKNLEKSLKRIIESSDKLSKIISNWEKADTFLMTLISGSANKSKSQLAFTRISSYNKSFNYVSFTGTDLIDRVKIYSNSNIFSQEGYSNTKQCNIPGATKIVINKSANRRPGEYIFITNKKISDKITKVFNDYLGFEIETFVINNEIAEFKAEEKFRREERARIKKEQETFVKVLPISLNDFGFRLKTSEYRARRLDTACEKKFYFVLKNVKRDYCLDAYNIYIDDRNLHDAVFGTASSGLIRYLAHKISQNLKDTKFEVLAVKEEDVGALEAAGYVNLFKNLFSIISEKDFFDVVENHVNDWGKSFSIHSKLEAWLKENGDEGTYFEGFLTAKAYSRAGDFISSITNAINGDVFVDTDFTELKTLLNNLSKKIQKEESCYSNLDKRAHWANELLNKYYSNNDIEDYVFDLIIKDCRNV